MIDTENGPTLYEHTGSILDCNTMLVNRNELRAMLPWWRKLPLCWNKWKRYHKFRIHMAGTAGVEGTSNDQRQVREDSQGLGEPGRLSPTPGVLTVQAPSLPMEATREMVDAACKAFGYPGGDRSLYARAWKVMAEHAAGVESKTR